MLHVELLYLSLARTKAVTVANKQSLRTKTVLEYLEKFPNSSKRTLAEKIYNENNLAFSDIEDARSLIKRLTGSKGKGELKLKK